MMRITDIDEFAAYLAKHKVPEEKIKVATAKIRALRQEADKLYRKITAAGDARTANLAIKRINKIALQANEIMVDVLDDAKSDSMRRTGRKKNENDTQEKDQ